MLLYIINLITVYILCLLSRFFYEKSNRIISFILLLLAFISMLFISGFRYGVGTDYFNYEYIFKSISWGTDIVEKGYIILNLLTKYFTKDCQMIFLITSFIILIIFFIAIKHNSKRYELSMFLFISMYHFATSMNLIRQYIAIAIVFYGTKYVLNENFKKYMLCIFIASMFHVSSIIMILIYPLKNKVLSLKHILILLGITIYVYVNFINILSNILVFLPKYRLYIENDLSLLNNGTYLNIVVYGILFLITYLYKNKLILDGKNNIFYINMMIITFILSIISLKTVLVGRVLLYFSIYSILIIPNLLDIFNIKQRIMVYLTIIYVGIIYYIVLLSYNFSNVLPFEFRFLG